MENKQLHTTNLGFHNFVSFNLLAQSAKQCHLPLTVSKQPNKLNQRHVYQYKR